MNPFPPPRQSQVWLDFDGTMTRRDLLDDLIVRYSVDESWKQIEQLWQSGEIGSQQCLQRQIALLRISDGELQRFLQTIEIDSGLPALLNLLDRFEVPRAVLSDGVDHFIRQTLERNNLSLTIRSNTIHRKGLELDLKCPLYRDNCESKAAHCKCGSMQELSTPDRSSIYVGDGRSDLCPARKADFVFAKGALAAALEKENIPFVRFTTLLDVKEALERHWAV
jgi:2,3-diketo-5-methylthio-1-phosphopentane phosphatase